MSKYTYYALGEILLVVIGILIALQINNWNEDRKLRQAEKDILIEILEDIRISKDDLENDIQQEKKIIVTATKVLNTILNKEPYYDNLETDMIAASASLQFTPRTVGYKTLNARGIDIIQNSALRNEIVINYEIRITSMEHDGRDYDQFSNPTLELTPFISNHLNIDNSVKMPLTNEATEFTHYWYGLKLHDYEALLNDREFTLLLQKTIVERFSRIAKGERLYHNLETLTEAIKSELKTEFN